MTAKVEFPNLQSRLLLKPWFDRQFIIPEAPPRALQAFLRFYERRVLRVDTGHIEIDRPIFLLSLPRAGSTLLQNVLCAHPEIAYISHSMHMFRETFCATEDLRRRLNLNAKGQRYLGDSVDVEAQSPCDPVVFWAEWLGVDLQSVDYQPRRLADFSEAQLEKIRATIKRIMWCFGPGARRFFTKNPGLLPYVELLSEMFPGAKFINLIRDPRDAANSLLKLYRRDREQFEMLKREHPGKVNIDQPFIPYPRIPRLPEILEEYGPDDVRATAHIWNDAVSFLDGLKDGVGAFLDVRYEDILRDPQGKAEEILAFCELPPIGPDNWKFRDLIDSVGVLRHANRYGDFDVIEAICRDNMQRYGYA